MRKTRSSYGKENAVSEYDGKNLKYTFLHEKMHQFIAEAGIHYKYNTDGFCNYLVGLLIKHIEDLFPESNFLSSFEFEEWIKWQKSVSRNYSE